jgi:4-amino-4-deoxy-L-arabinose transferase-like glycosyltransferase
MGEMPRKIPRLLWLALPMAYLLYFFDLDGKGMFGPDEPRYASIAREMARSGDWITPRLWGHPWFEKPALLYWMNGAAFRLGLGPDLAPRLPVAILSVAFLVFYWWILNREFGCRAAWFATLILSTCACWIGWSQVGVTDLPLAATFSAAMLLALPWMAKGDTRWLPGAALLLGFAVLAKSLVPLVLAAPLVLNYRRFRDLLHPRVWLPFLAIVLPWHILCYARNGRAFTDDLFVKQQFHRVTSAALMHVRPWWYYAPVLLALLLPWTPLLPLIARRTSYGDPRRRFLLALLLWGFLFFSISLNKLPGYLLPLYPAAAALIGIALHEAHRARLLLILCALLLVAFPIGAGLVAPAVITGGLSRIPWPHFEPIWLLPLTLVPLIWFLEERGRRLAAVACVAAGATLGTVYLKRTAADQLDSAPSARAVWRQVAAHADQVCTDGIDRGLQYALNYYAGSAVPECEQSPKPLHIREAAGRPSVSASIGQSLRVDQNSSGSVTSTLRD